MKVSALALVALATSPSSCHTFSPSPSFLVQRRSAVQPLNGNGGMDAYDAAMKQAYGQQAPPAAAAPVPPPAPVAPGPAPSEPINWGAAAPAAPPAAPAASEPINWGAAAAPAAPAAPAAVSAAPVAPATPAVSTPAVGGGGGAASAESAIATLSTSQAASVDKIASTIGPDLELKPDLSWTAETVGGSAATLDGREAPGANGNVAWLANVNVDGTMSSLTIFNGPLTDVPHLLSRAVIVGGGRDSIRFTLDFRPRAYGAYEMRDSDGNYPGPDVLGRDAFTYSGNRNDFDGKFGNEEVVAFVEGLKGALEGGVVNDSAPSELDSLTRGPLYIDITCPLTEGNVAAINNARSQAADYWLSWAMDGSHAHRPGAPVNSQYVYDSKYKINSYGALLEEYKELFGGDGVKLAAAESGPLDEAYVGGGS